VFSHWKAFLSSWGFRLPSSLLLLVAVTSGPWIPGASATSGHLHVSPGNLEFQTVVVGHTTRLTFKIMNTASSKLCIYHLYSSKNQFAVSGPSTPANIFPSMQPVSVPQQETTASPVQPTPPPVVHLSWAPSESALAGYRVYHSLTQSGPFVDYNPGPLDAWSFDDTSVLPGAIYFYVVTALDTEGDESIFSNQAMVALSAR
jgi:hypothetical protein